MPLEFQQAKEDVEFQANVVRGFPVVNQMWRGDYANAVAEGGRFTKLAQRPQNPSDGVLYGEMAKKYLALADKYKSYIVDVPEDPKKWNQQHLRLLANHKMGYAVMDALANLVMEAGNTDATGKYTAEAVKAQYRLDEFAPQLPGKTRTGNLVAFIEDIRTVALETKEVRKKYRDADKAKKPTQAGFGKTGAVFDVSPEIQGNPLEDRKFDQQEALALLERSGVVKDADDGLKKPLDTAVTDAVKGIKGSISLAA